MEAAATDYDAIDAMLHDLPQLLEGDHLFREVVVERGDGHAGAEKITLTLSALLEALDAAAHARADEQRLHEAQEALAAQREARSEAYASTLRRELRSALNDWRALAADLEDEGDDLADAWAYGIQNRSRAERLLGEAREHSLTDGGAAEAIAALDRRIRRQVEDAPFQGPPAERDRFPRTRWWWLWSAPPG